jgi:hypothetical protein
MFPINFWIEDIWTAGWPGDIPSTGIISLYHELYKKTESYTTDAIVLETNVTSDMILMIEKIVNQLFEDDVLATDVNNLIQTRFISGTDIDNDIENIKAFAVEFDTLLNG